MPLQKGNVKQNVTIKVQSPGSPNISPATANPGFIRPPFVYLFSLIVGVLIQLATPLPFLPRAHTMPVGIALIGVAVFLFSWSVRTFRAADTPLAGSEPTTAIVWNGPYRFSRNPIYLAFSLFELGIAIWADSLWLLATLAAAVAVMHRIVIPREEGYLERRFGSQYLDYKTSVGRWV